MGTQEIGQFFLDILDKYGIPGVLLIAAGIILFKFGNKLAEALAQKITEGKFSFHSNTARKVRKDAVFKINRLLTEIMSKLGADRSAIFEYHNGGYNLTGLPFLHFSLTIQRNRLGVDELSKDFDNLLVSSVPDFINNIDKNVIYFVKDLDDLQFEFPRLYRELIDDGMSCVVFCSLEGIYDQVGFLMLAFKDPIEISKDKITKELLKKTQKVSTLLDYKNQK